MKWFLIVMLAACGGKKEEGMGSAAPAKHGDLKVELGECSAPGAAFVSGPPSQSGQILAITGAADKFGKKMDQRELHPASLVGNGPTALNATGDLDKAIIRRYVKRNIQKIQYCYEKQLLGKPGLAGTVMVRFFIATTGQVTSATAAGVDPEIASCVAAVVKTIEFPRPKGGGGVQVNYPFTFKSTEGSTTPPQAPAKPEGKPEDKDESKNTGTAMALDEGKMGSKDAGPDASPIAPLAGEVSSCATNQPLAYGAFAIEWSGAAPTVIGVDDKKFAACILEVAKKAVTKQPMRCGVSFGAVPDGERHRITIDDKDIKFDGNVVDHVASVVSEKTIAALGDSFDKHLSKISATTVAVRGPVWLEPAAKTPMAVVNAIMKNAANAKVDLVLADSAGKPLIEVKPPVAPVDAAKPGSWTGMMPITATDENESVVLSITINKTNMFVGLSRVNEFMEVKERDWDGLERQLTENKKSAFFSDRQDIEIGASDDSVYDDVVQAIQRARKVGFTSWKVYPADQLTGKPTL